VHDGRKSSFARPGAVVATTLTVIGLGLATAGPAAAAPDTSSRIRDTQAVADRLDGRVHVAEKRHDAAHELLVRDRARLEALRVVVERQRRTVLSLRAELVGMAADDSPTSSYDAGAGTAAPAPSVTGDSATLLTNVVVVSQDTDGVAQQLVRSTERLAVLAHRRPAAQQQVATARTREKRTAASAAVLRAQAGAADAKVQSLQEQLREEQARAEAERVGPAVQYAMAQVGNAYVYGAAGPSAFDCSGLTMAAWATAGVSLPHSSSAQYASGRHISESELQPGDLVFYYSPISHVGMYIGGGKIVNALNPGAGVKVSGLHDMPYVGAVRPG
jgi:cell wall-associated NlpC family hydrolase